MKILVGVDPEGHFRSALTLLSRMEFPHSHLTLLSVDERATFPVALPTTPTYSGSKSPVGLHHAGEKVLSKAAVEARAAGLDVSVLYDAGRADSDLLLQAYQLPADLVAIGSRARGRAASFVLGSVGKALAESASHSFLVAHGEIAPMGALNIVYATDLSNYCDRGIDLLLDWAPKGIGKVTIVHALHHEDSGLHWPKNRSTEVTDADIAAAVTVTEATARRFREYGYLASTVVRSGRPAEVIGSEMENGADLLVMAARGHGFLERLTIGSVAMDQVVGGKHPVLVLRP